MQLLLLFIHSTLPVNSATWTLDEPDSSTWVQDNPDEATWTEQD